MTPRRMLHHTATVLALMIPLVALFAACCSADSGRFHVNIGFSSRAFINTPPADVKIAVNMRGDAIISMREMS